MELATTIFGTAIIVAAVVFLVLKAKTDKVVHDVQDKEQSPGKQALHYVKNVLILIPVLYVMWWLLLETWDLAHMLTSSRAAWLLVPIGGFALTVYAAYKRTILLAILMVPLWIGLQLFIALYLPLCATVPVRTQNIFTGEFGSSPTDCFPVWERRS
jgi:hypothetical protein